MIPIAGCDIGTRVSPTRATRPVRFVFRQSPGIATRLADENDGGQDECAPPPKSERTRRRAVTPPVSFTFALSSSEIRALVGPGMHPPKPLRGGFFTRALSLLLVLAPATLFAQQGPREYSIRDQGKTRTFEIAADELLISRHGSKAGELAGEVRTKLDKAKVVAEFGAKVLVKLDKAVDPR